jgi:two-component system, chemotaxis family, chemotaxis protein CheY
MSSGGHILFIDDDESIREFVTMALTDEGYEVATAQNGAAALDLIKRKQPDLILLDMRMPVMDGWAFMKAYDGTPMPHAPIIALTASRNSPDVQVPAEVSGFLAKPFDLSDLLDMIGKNLHP